MFDKHARLEEAKLMAVEKIVNEIKDYHYCATEFISDYEYAKRILSAIKDAEIAQELRDHEASLEEASGNKPE